MVRIRSWVTAVLGALALAFAAVVVPVVPAAAIPPFPIVDDTTGTPGEVNPAWDSALSGVDNPGGTYTVDDWMRLTDNRGNLGTSLLWDTAFPSTTGFTIDFDYRQAGGTEHCVGGACRTGDGMSVFLVDGAEDVSAGAFGAGLGYAGNEVTCGVVGGYLGIGLDVYGNFARSTVNATGGPGVSPSMLGVRGSGTQPCGVIANYPWVTGTTVPDLWTGVSGSTTDPAVLPDALYRHVRVVVLPADDTLTLTVYISDLTPKDEPYGALALVLETDIADVPGQVDLPPTLKLGFGASTGGATNYHDIRDIRVTALADASITKALAPETPGRDGMPPGTFFPGDPISFVLTATNLGPTAIGNPPDGVARILDDLSGLGITDVTWTCTPLGDAACITPAGTGPVVQADWVAASGDGVQVRIDGTVAADAVTADLTNTALVPTQFDTGTVGQDGSTVQLDGGATDPDTSNNTATQPFAVLVPEPALELVKEADRTELVAGETITYTVTATNTGNVPLTGVAVTEEAFDGAGAISDLTCATEAPVTLEPGAQQVCTATYTVQQEDVDNGGVTNTAAVAGTPPVGTDVTAEASLSVLTVPAPGLTLVKRVAAVRDLNENDVVDLGDEIDYEFDLTNTGNLTLDDVVVDDDLLAASQIGVTCAATTLAPGESTTCAADAGYVITQADVDAGEVVNSATAGATSSVGPFVSEADGAVVPVDQSPGLELVKRVAAVRDVNRNGVTDAGDEIDYEFDLTNTGNVTLTELGVDDDLLDDNGIAVICPSAPLAPGDTTTCAAEGPYVITRADVDAGYVLNVAIGHATPPVGPPVVSDPDLVTSDTDDPPPLAATGVTEATIWAGRASLVLILLGLGAVLVARRPETAQP